MSKQDMNNIKYTKMPKEALGKKTVIRGDEKDGREEEAKYTLHS